MNKYELLAVIIATNALQVIVVLLAAVYLSKYTGNYHWMWLLSMLIVTRQSATFKEQSDSDKPEDNKEVDN